MQELIDLRGLTHQDVSVRAGLSKSAVNTYFRKNVMPGGKALLGIARVLGVSVDYILTGNKGEVVKIPIVGIVSAGEGWSAQHQADFSRVDFDLDTPDAIAIEVRGDSMNPVYRNGDYLICSRQLARHVDNLIGLDCAVMTAAGDGYVKILKRGTTRGRFTLKSYNPMFDDIENVELAWVAPIQWIRRSKR